MRRALACVLVVLGCGGGGSVVHDAASVDAFTADAAVDSTAADGAPDARADLPPLPPAALRLLLPNDARLSGSGDNSCSRGEHATPADVWCAFTRTIDGGADAGATVELWVIDATRAAAGDAIACDGTSPQCRRLNADLWTGGALGGPLFPSDDGFDGDTLFFYAGGISTKPDGVYQGPVWAWRPGWAEARMITSDKGLLCFGHPRAPVAYCIENVQQGPPVQFDVHAGTLVDGPNALPLLATGIHAWKGSDIAWHAEFSPDASRFALSGVEPSTGAEVLQAGLTAELGKTPLRELAYDATAWRISLDGQKIYYLHGYVGDPMPGGTLMMADFPSGANATDLQTNVASFTLLGEPGAVDRGLGFFQDQVMGVGKFRVMADRTQPTQVVTVVDMIDGVDTSPDGRFATFEQDDAQGFTRVMVAPTAGGSPCVLNALPAGDVFGVHFLDGGQLVFWNEIDDSSVDGVAQGWVARPDGCAEKQRFADKSSFVYTFADRVAVSGFNKPDEIRYALEHAHIGGATPFVSPATPIIEGADATIAALPGDRGLHLLVEIPDGPIEKQGVYLYGPIAY